MYNRTLRLSAIGLLDGMNTGFAGALVESRAVRGDASKKRTKKFTASLETGHGYAQSMLLSEVQFIATARSSIFTTA
jgi:hypothetical protein